MSNIVNTGMKIDLHIHSKVSSIKDGKKVKNNTIGNIPVLIDKLSENDVNICAITDHDAFSYEMYTTLKAAEKADNPIQKVLPGIEFSVKFEFDDIQSVIHVVAIFSDEDDEKVKNIETNLKDIKTDSNGTYSEERFLQLLRLIDIDTILIAHQKNSLTSSKPRKNDANSLGDKKFLEFVYTDYFEAFEFKNKRNEILNKSYLVQAGLEEQLRFVTGTDCHDWSVYPAEDLSDSLEEFPYTYAKCLPTFKGLVMAITDHTRLKMINSFFNVDRCSIDNIELTNQGKTITIPLSKGINVIIGDNSIGKSMLLHAITGFNKDGPMKLPTKVREGYKRYLQQYKLKVESRIPPNKIFCFDMQGEVRAKFEENKLNTTDFLKEYFPQAIDARPYQSMVENEIIKMISYLETKFKLDRLIKDLNPFNINVSEDNAESLTFIKNLRQGKPKSAQINKVVSAIDVVLVSLKQLNLLSSNLDTKDTEYIGSVISSFNTMKKKYSDKIEHINNECDRIERVAKIIDEFDEIHRKGISDSQKKSSTFAESTTALKSQLITILRTSKEIVSYEPKLSDLKIQPNFNRVYNYQFVSKFNIDMIGTNYLNTCIKKVLKANKSIKWDTITENELQEMLLRYDESVPVLQFFKKSLLEVVAEDFSSKNAIIYQGEDKYAEMSTGLDAKIYFDLLSYETTHDGIYIIDQPEDNISQTAIKSYLLDRFKTMGENRQIIMVTHNPQFIVNLDIDNLVFMSQKDGVIHIQSGALEYVCKEYNVLDIVAQNVDGGLDSIRKRWKRYEKTTDL